MVIENRLSHFIRDERARTILRGRVAQQKAIANRINAIVVDVLRRRFPLAKLPGDATFDALGVDAFERVYIADEIEREWNIAIPDELIDAWRTVEDATVSTLALLPQDDKANGLVDSERD
jgi:acyl carrier protein